MALRAVVDHPKFARLKNILRMNKACTLGYLEGLWHFCGRYTPSGNIGKYSPEEIEAWLEWDGEDGALVAAMVKARWIDVCPVNGMVVHDWSQHADAMVHADLAKKTLLFVDGTAPRLNSDSFNADTRNRIKKEFLTKFGRDVWVKREESSSHSPGLVQDETDESPRQSSAIPEPVPGTEPVPEPERTREEIPGDSLASKCLSQLRVLACVQNCKNQTDEGQIQLLENLFGRVKLDFPPGEDWDYWAGWVASRASSKPAYTSPTNSVTAAAVLETFVKDIRAELERRKSNREALGDQFGGRKDDEPKLGRDYLIDPVTGDRIPVQAGAK